MTTIGPHPLSTSLVVSRNWATRHPKNLASGEAAASDMPERIREKCRSAEDREIFRGPGHGLLLPEIVRLVFTTPEKFSKGRISA